MCDVMRLPDFVKERERPIRERFAQLFGKGL
jgi:hypothetical protein